MAEITITTLRRVLIPLMFLLHGCASNEVLFAEYDEYFCQVTQEYSESTVTEVIVTIPWEPVISFAAGSDELTPESMEKLKTNVRQLSFYPGHVISLGSLSRQRPFNKFNRVTLNNRLNTIKSALIDTLGLNPDQVVEADVIEEPTLSAANDSLVDVPLVDIDRRVELQLLDSDLMVVPLQSRKYLSDSGITDIPVSNHAPSAASPLPVNDEVPESSTSPTHGSKSELLKEDTTGEQLPSNLRSNILINED